MGWLVRRSAWSRRVGSYSSESDTDDMEACANREGERVDYSTDSDDDATYSECSDSDCCSDIAREFSNDDAEDADMICHPVVDGISVNQQSVHRVNSNCYIAILRKELNSGARVERA